MRRRRRRRRAVAGGCLRALSSNHHSLSNDEIFSKLPWPACAFIAVMLSGWQHTSTAMEALTYRNSHSCSFDADMLEDCAIVVQIDPLHGMRCGSSRSARKLRSKLYIRCGLVPTLCMQACCLRKGSGC